MNGIAVSIEHQQVGLITLLAPANYLESHRTAGGFRLHLPINVSLRMERGATIRPLLTNLRAALSYQANDGVVHHLGQAESSGIFAGAAPEWTGYAELIWSDTLAALVFYERLRNGKPPRIKMRVTAEICWLFNTNRWLRTEPFLLSGEAEANYPIHVWISMLRDLKVTESILVEVPVAGVVPTGWEGVWRELREARDAFEQGGDAGWSHCLVSVRKALEQWAEIEPERKPFNERPKEDWTKRERLEGLRWQLHQYAHLAAHSTGESWSRDEALLVLSILSALLAVRKP